MRAVLKFVAISLAVVVALVVVAAGAGFAMLRQDGLRIVTQAQARGLLSSPANEPLSLAERTVIASEFSSQWNERPFSRMLFSEIVSRLARGPLRDAGVSHAVARNVVLKVDGPNPANWHFKVLMVSGLLEGRYSDSQLLRLFR